MVQLSNPYMTTGKTIALTIACVLTKTQLHLFPNPIHLVMLQIIIIEFK